MKSVDTLIKLAARFARKISLAQAVSAQPNEIYKAFGNTVPTSQSISPLLDTAKVPENVKLDIKATVAPNFAVNFQVNSSPNHGSAHALKSLLDKNFAGRMAQTLKGSGLNIASPMTINIATF